MFDGPAVRLIGDELNRFVGMTITEAHVFSGRYNRGSAIDQAALVGATIARIAMKGKLIAFVLTKDSETFVALSAVGTGQWQTELPPHPRVQLSLSGAGDVTLYFNDQRNFGTFKIATYAEMKRKFAELGPDIMSPPSLWASITLPEFETRVLRFGKKLTVAEALQDQRIAAGVGAFISSKALALTNTSVTRPISELSIDELHALWQVMYDVATNWYMENV